MSDQATREEIRRTLANMKQEPIEEDSQQSSSLGNSSRIRSGPATSPRHRSSPRVVGRTISPVPGTSRTGEHSFCSHVPSHSASPYSQTSSWNGPNLRPHPYPDTRTESLRRELYHANMEAARLEAALSRHAREEQFRVMQRTALEDKFERLRFQLEHAEVCLNDLMHDIRLIKRGLAQTELATQHELEKMLEKFGTPVPSPYAESHEEEE